jgi:hypothetical protein
MRSRSYRAVATAAVAAIALTSMAFTPATAAPVANHQSAASQVTDFSAQRRVHHRYYRHNRGADRAVLGAVAGLFGTVATLAARDRYERHYGYGYYGGPYYAPPPYAYGPRPYYPY